MNDQPEVGFLTAPSEIDGLPPCPFCGAGETQVREHKYWTGMSYLILSVEIVHWCEEGQAAGVRGSSVIMRGKTLEIAKHRWNRCKIAGG